ncbi:LlaJI family restriction endonuclease [Paenibacillus sp. Soil787]|uniref:LlaJI family restriction endonuclease n=1 Tax=Paenibacillus sp. Soil787 TaxID=1736411 RepID=UPI0006FDC75E|nr:LlaJI family restriction endonuclease [Paenibacillus sp. Soil787]KRF39830.1 hypothetical protein ASG93_22980 [Paenibacillus sp. Soil787]
MIPMMKNKKYVNFEVAEHQYKLKIKCFVELLSYNEDEVAGIDFQSLINLGYCKLKRSQYSFHLIGFFMAGSTLVVIFPKGYRLPTDYSEVLSHIKILAGALFRYKEEGNIDPEEAELLSGAEFGGRSNIASALWLMRDYINYGFIKRELKVQRVKNGATVDWARTVKTMDPYVINNRPVYLDYVVREKSNDYFNRLVQLHQYAVKESFQSYGWMLNQNDINADLLDSEMPFSEREIGVILHDELSVTNSDREIILIRTLQRFLLGSENQNKSDSLDTFATPYFHNVWEKVCGVLFKNEYHKLKHLIPNPVWKWSSSNKNKSTVQIPDILFRDDGVLYILDAKYYDTSRNLPGWHDLVKQYFYAYSLKDIESSYVNVMVFPTIKDDLLSYEGFSIVEDRHDLGRIEAVSLNTHHALKSYSLYRECDLREFLKQVLSQNN